MAHNVTAGHLADPHAHADAHANPHGEAWGNENMKFAMWLFLGSEVMFFTVLIAAYLYARYMAPEQHALLNIPLTSLGTFILLASSFVVVRALAAIQIGDRLKFLRSLALVALLGGAFLGIQAYEYTHLGHEGLTLSGAGAESHAADGSTEAAPAAGGEELPGSHVSGDAQSNPEARRIFGMAFYSLTGFHGFHVLIGLIWGIIVFWNAFTGKYTQERHFGVEFFGLYWHFVDVVWIIIFTVVYLI